MRTGLRDMSFTAGMSSGALFGRGIYLSSELAVSRMFSSLAPGWHHASLGTHFEIVGVYAVATCTEFVNCEQKAGSSQKHISGVEVQLLYGTINILHTFLSLICFANQVPEKYYVVSDPNYVRLIGLAVWTRRHSSIGNNVKTSSFSRSAASLQSPVPNHTSGEFRENDSVTSISVSVLHGSVVPSRTIGQTCITLLHRVNFLYFYAFLLLCVALYSSGAMRPLFGLFKKKWRYFLRGGT